MITGPHQALHTAQYRDSYRAAFSFVQEPAAPPPYPSGMTEPNLPSVRPQPMISVADVQQASHWYQQVLGFTSGHGGPEYEQLLVDGQLVMQLHKLEIGHHHGTLGNPDQPLGNGVALWFEADAFDAAVRRIRQAEAHIVTDVHTNPNAGHQEIWLRDLDGYLVVIAGHRLTG